MTVQARSDKPPELIEPDGSAEQQPSHCCDLQLQHKWIGHAGESQGDFATLRFGLGYDVIEWRTDPGEELRVEEPPDDHADDHGDR